MVRFYGFTYFRYFSQLCRTLFAIFAQLCAHHTNTHIQNITFSLLSFTLIWITFCAPFCSLKQMKIKAKIKFKPKEKWFIDREKPFKHECGECFQNVFITLTIMKIVDIRWIAGLFCINLFISIEVTIFEFSKWFPRFWWWIIFSIVHSCIYVYLWIQIYINNDK